MKELLKLGALDLAEKIHRKDVKPSEVTDLFIDRVESINPALNALVVPRFDEARIEAKKADDVLMSTPKDELPPLLGVPFSIKEVFGLKGYPNTYGSLRLKDNLAEHTATVIARAMDAGAIPLGLTNIPEWGMWFETTNLVYGRTNNPYDLDRTSGGSSGGEAALLAANGTAFSIGSDIGGSIRMPAFFCGIFGHKPTNKVVPNTGHIPMTNDKMQDFAGNRYPYVTVGPMTKTSKDMFFLMSLLAGADGIDTEVKQAHYDFKPDLNWKNKKVFLCPNPTYRFVAETQPELQDEVRKTGQILKELGADVQDFDGSIFKDTFLHWSTTMSTVEGLEFTEKVGVTRLSTVIKELALATIDKHTVSFHTLMVCLGELLSKGGKVQDVFLKQAKEVENKLNETLGDNGILITPPHPRTAFKHNSATFRPFDFAPTALFNYLQFPSTAVPTGFDSQGLPTGVQISATQHNDVLTMSAAWSIEEALKGQIKHQDQDHRIERQL